MIWDITETELSHLWESQKYDMIISSSKMGCTFFTFTVGYNSPLIRELWDMGGSWLPDVGKKILHLDLLMPQNVFDHLLTSTKEEFEDTEGVIRIRKSKENRQHNGQKKKDKQRSTKHTHKTKDRVTRTTLKTGGNSGE